MSRNKFPVLTERDYRLPFYLTSSGGWENQMEIRRPGGYPDYQWIHCLAGGGELRVGEESLSVSAGQGMFLYPGEAHTYGPVAEPWTVRWITFNGRRCEELVRDLGLTGSCVLQPSQSEHIVQEMQELHHWNASRSPLRNMECSALIYRILLQLSLSAALPRSREEKWSGYERLMPVLDYIEEHCGDPLALQDLADLAGCSKQRLCLLFKRILGMRPFEYVNRSRIQRAKQLLLTLPDPDIASIAEMSGYEHTSYFIKQFKKSEKLTPGEFRKMHKSQ